MRWFMSYTLRMKMDINLYMDRDISEEQMGSFVMIQKLMNFPV